MMKFRTKSHFLGPAFLCTMIVCVANTPLLAQPAAAEQKKLPAARTLEQVLGEMQPALTELNGALEPAIMTSAAKRAEVAPKILPLTKKLLAFGPALEATGAEGKAVSTQIRSELLPIIALVADAESIAMLKQMSGSADPELARTAKLAMITADWWKSSQDAAAQAKVIAPAIELAKANATSNEIAAGFSTLARRGAASRELANQIAAVITDNMSGPFVDQFKQTWTAITGLHARENKPLVITGTTVDGKAFTTADLAGKVILVDFWAVWCLPCRAALPEVKQAYSTYHDKGFEIVGVSSDFSAQTLNSFIESEQGMPWPQLFDPTAAAKEKWNSIATGFDLESVGLPSMFLIDKKGILRTVDAAENFKEMIPKLLAE
ncbi:MAG: TlpA family protein disulfide reductase [Burkholderiales bacterium]|nr:TlpA family protein disulfide reductase [Phycisphaerae bacterium]